MRSRKWLRAVNKLVQIMMPHLTMISVRSGKRFCECNGVYEDLRTLSIDYSTRRKVNAISSCCDLSAFQRSRHLSLMP